MAAAVFYIPYSLFTVPAVWLTKFVQARLLLATLTFLWGFATFCTGFVTNSTELITLRILLGAAEAGSLPLIFYYLNLYFTPRDLAQLWSSAILVSINVATIVAAPVASLIIFSLEGALGLAAWRWVYFILGGVAILQAGFIGLFLVSKPSETDVLTV